jgi:hypothetical protein
LLPGPRPRRDDAPRLIKRESTAVVSETRRLVKRAATQKA